MARDGSGPHRVRRVLVLNAGSSSLKASLVELPATTIARTEVSWGADASRRADRKGGLEEALRAIGLEERGAATVDAVGHRVVHGGARFTAPARLDPEVLDVIREVSALAPLHNGVALETIEAAGALLADVPHVACFDTAFHATLDPEAYRYPVPEPWFREWGIRRFGFHGLSVSWAAQRAAALLGRDDASLVVAHLGSGCSVTAVEAGRSVDTSMGLTPLEGLMMGTRSGSIDPGVPLHLIARGHATPDEIAEALDHASGLLGVSGTSSDMRRLTADAEAGDERARLAIAMFARRAAAWMAAMAASLRRLDALVFTGGIGEHAAGVRAGIAERLAVLGVAPLPDPPAPADGDAILSQPGAAIPVLAVEAREDLVIASETARLLAG